MVTTPQRATRYAGFDGLYRSDPIELAALTFGQVFVDGTVASPRRDLDRVDQVIAWLAGVDINQGLFGMVGGLPYEQIQTYSLETVAIWQRELVAATRVEGSDHVRVSVYLLRRGEDLLRSADPVAMLRGTAPDPPEPTDLR